jgi:hypothetical protein
MSYFEESVEIVSVVGAVEITPTTCSRFVTLNTDGEFVLGAVNSRAFGVITTSQPADAAGRVAFAGTVPVEAGGTIAVGAQVASGANGVAVTATGTGAVPIGIARTAGASGGVVAVQLRLPGLAALT